MALVPLARKVLIVILPLLLIFGRAFVLDVKAQQSRDTKYKTLIEDAIEEYRLGHWDEARSLFEQAHAVSPSARTFRGLGMVAFEARDYVSCLNYLKRALKDVRKPLTTAQRTEVESLVARAQKFVGRFEVRLVPAEARLTIDGYPVLLQNGELLLNPGEHDLSVEASGYETLNQRLKVKSGRRSVLALSLEPLTGSTGQNAAEESAQQDQMDRSEPVTSEGIPSIVSYIVIGTGGALLLGSTLTGIMTLSARSDLDDGCDQDGHCYEDLQSTKERGESLKLATNVLLAAGAVTTTAGLIFLFLFPDESRHGYESQTASFGCIPGGCFGSINASF